MADDKKDSGNFAQRLAMAGAIGTGVGIGAKNFFVNHKLNSVFNKPIHKATYLNDFVGGFKSQSLFINQNDILGAASGIDPGTIGMAWDNALKNGDPARVLNRPILDASNPLQGISHFTNRNTSWQGNKVLTNFLGQLRSLNKHNLSTPGGQITAGFSNLSKRNFVRAAISLDSIQDPILKETLTGIRNSISTIGGEMNLRMAQREGVDGAQLMVHMSGGKFGTGSVLELPMEIAGQEGVIASGTTLQTKRIVGRVGVIDGNNRIVSTLKHEQYVARRFQEKILPQIMTNDRLSKRRLNSMITEFNQSMIEHSQVIPNVPRNTVPAVDIAARLGASRRLLVDETYDTLDSSRMGGVFQDQSNGLFPSTSGNQLSKGVASTLNAQKLWLGGEAFPWERRPMQAFGRGYSPSQSAFTARYMDPLRKQYSWLQTPEYKELFGESHTEFFAKTAYINEGQHVGLAEKILGGVAGGGGLRSDSLDPQLQHIEALDSTLSINGLNKKLVAAMEGSETGVHEFSGLSFNDGEILGYDNNGHPLHYENGMDITGAIEGASKENGIVKLTGYKSIIDESGIKVFASGKAVVTKDTQWNVNKILQEGTGHRMDNIGMALGMDELKKNRALHNLQMLTSLHDFTYDMMKKSSVRARQGMETARYKSLVGKLTSLGNNPGNNIGAIYNLAKEHSLPANAIGRIFGALPAVHGSDWVNEMKQQGLNFSDNEISHINHGIATGVMPFVYGGPSSGGGRGGIEPRLFDILHSGHFGKFGTNVADSLTERMILGHPETAAEQSILGSALSSLANGASPMDGVSQYHIKNMGEKEMSDIITHGGILDTGGIVDGVGKIRVPGLDSSYSMRGWTSPDGVTSVSKLAHSYEDFMEIGREALNGRANRADVGPVFDRLVNTVGSAYTGTITGKGVGLARNKMPGSRYLRLIAGTTEQLGDLNTLGISHNSAMSMLNELEDTYKGNHEELAHISGMRERIIKNGEIGAISVRDPVIGPFSSHFGKIKIIPGLDDTHVLIPQQTKTLSDAAGNEIGKVGMGPLFGWAGDVDGDHAHIMLTSSKIEKDVMGHYSVGSSHSREYEDYIIRQQLLKAKAPKGVSTLSAGEDMAFAAEKLMLAKTEVGKLSIPLSQMRRSLGESSSISSERSLNAMSLLEGLEQNAIAAKHYTSEQLSTMGQQVSNLARAASAGRGHEVTSIAADMFKHNPSALNLLTNDQEVLINGEKRTIKGLNLHQVGEDLTSAMSGFRKNTSSVNESTLDKMLRGQIKVNKSSINDLLNYSGGKLGAFKLSQAESTSGRLVRSAMGVRNKVMAMGGEILEHAGKPLAIGFGAALAIGAIMSKPLSTLSPGSSAPPVSSGRIQTDNTSSIPPENVHPDSQVSGQPTNPGVMSGPSARLRLNEGNSANVHIRGVSSGTNLASLTSVINTRLGKNTTTNLNIRDKRTSMSQDKIDSLIRR